MAARCGAALRRWSERVAAPDAWCWSAHVEPAHAPNGCELSENGRDDLCFNEIGDAGATQLADALRTTTSVEFLYPSSNSIGDAGATQLADALRTNTSVEVLTSATTRSVMRARRSSLTRCARTNTSVKELHLHNNSIGEAGATQLADALRTNTSVKKLYPAPTPAMR